MNQSNMSRRGAVRQIAAGAASIPFIMGSMSLLNSCGNTNQSNETKEANASADLFFSISLAQWSLNRSIFGASRQLDWGEFGKRLQSDPGSLLLGEIDPLDFPVVARQQFGLSAVEYVNTFYFDKATNSEYMAELKNRCDGEGVKSQLIMCDALGNLGDTDDAARIMAVENHYKWVDAAKYLGCHSIRVNAAGQGTADEVKTAAVDGLGRLSSYGKAAGINIIVENHGGFSSNGMWLMDVISQVGNEYCGTLPDFGNFCITRGASGCEDSYDKYKGVEELLPFAKGVSAKSYDFDESGNETTIDYARMLSLVKASGFTGYIGIEYEGDRLSEPDGIKATIDLLKKAGSEII